jgi:GDP-fucose transporter C1
MQTLAGLVGFALTIAILLDIKYTAPLTHNLSGTVKATLRAVPAFVSFKNSEHMTVVKFIGLVLVIGFSPVYASVRESEMKRKIEAGLLNQQPSSDHDEKKSP